MHIMNVLVKNTSPKKSTLFPYTTLFRSKKEEKSSCAKSACMKGCSHGCKTKEACMKACGETCAEKH